MRKLKIVALSVFILLIILGLITYYSPRLQSLLLPWLSYRSSVYQKPVEDRTVSDWIVIGAREEVLNRVIYDASYQRLDYPMGDVNPNVGACTDVVIRALRKAEYDLQQLIHEDMKSNFELYPKLWGLSKTDSNIDHRRVPNQMVFFQSHGNVLPIEYDEMTKDTWKAGDIVCWKMPAGLYHTGVISDRKNRVGVPLVIHNAFITIEDSVLLDWEIIGHYRYPANTDN